MDGSGCVIDQEYRTLAKTTKSFENGFLSKDEDDEGDTCRPLCTFIGHRVYNPCLDFRSCVLCEKVDRVFAFERCLHSHHTTWISLSRHSLFDHRHLEASLPPS